MTKEEIWELLDNSEKYSKDYYITEAQVYDAMDTFAKQTAIAFDVWKRVNLYTLDYPNNRYIKLIISDGKARTEMVSVDDVYTQFIEQQNKGK